MKVATIFKWAMNPADHIAAADGSVSWAANRPEDGDDDHAAIQAAVDAAGDQEIIGITAASGETAFGASRGAHRTLAVDGLSVDAQPLQIARAYAAAIQKEGDVSVVTIGDSAWNPMVPALLAGILGWPAISAVDAVRPDGDGLIVTRRYGTGTQDVSVAGPVVLAVSARREEEEKPGMRVVLQARKKPVETLDIADLGIGEGGVCEVKSHRKPDSAAARIFDATVDLDGAVAQMVQAMQMEGVL